MIRTVKLEKFWLEVGELLLVHRRRQGWTASDVERAGGPTYKTAQSIEKGKIGTVSNLQLHSHALGLKVSDVLRSVLAPQELSPEVAQIIRVYETTTIEGRLALTQVARAVEELGRQAMPKTPTDPGRSGGGTHS